LTARLDRLEAHAARVDEAVAVPPELAPPAASAGDAAAGYGGLPSTTAVGALAGMVCARLGHLERRLAAGEIVQRPALDAALAHQEERAAASMARVVDGCASRDAMAALTDGHSALAAQLSAVEGVVATKVDKSDLLRLQATATELTSFAGWKAAASADIRELYTRAEEGRGGLAKCVDSLGKLSGLMQTLAESDARKADR